MSYINSSNNDQLIWLVVLNIFYFPQYLGMIDWLAHIFQRIETTNQYCNSWVWEDVDGSGRLLRTFGASVSPYEKNQHALGFKDWRHHQDMIKTWHDTQQQRFSCPRLQSATTAFTAFVVCPNALQQVVSRVPFCRKMSSVARTQITFAKLFCITIFFCSGTGD